MPILVAIWEAIVVGIPWIIGYFTVDKITSHLGASADDKRKLLDAVSKQCKDLNLTPDQCNALISQTQSEASTSSNLGDLVKWGIGGFLAIEAIKAFSKK